MQPTMRVIYPDGRQESHPITPETDTYELLKKLIGGWLEYVPAHSHALQDHEAVIDEEGMLKELAPNWHGSRLIGLDLTQYPPLHGPIVIVPHDPEDGPSPAQQRQNMASGNNLVSVYARALEGDAEALATLGISGPDEITVIDAREAAPLHLYLMQPDGHTERQTVGGNDEAHEWIDGKLGEAYRVPPEECGVQAYAVIYSAAPGDVRPNGAAQKALDLQTPVYGPVVFAPTGQADPSPAHQRLSEALSGNAAARAELGITANW